MASKNEPGKYDCHAKAEPDEPLFTLLGRDPDAPILVETWAAMREFGDDAEQVEAALKCAAAMREWLQKLGKTESSNKLRIEKSGSKVLIRKAPLFNWERLTPTEAREFARQLMSCADAAEAYGESSKR